MSEIGTRHWNAERLLDGWKWGKEKDVEKKIAHIWFHEMN